MQERLRQALDFRRHGRREEQGLAREGHQPADALDVGDEAHVEHAVGLVDDEDLDAGQQQLAALEMVEQAAGSGDQHVDAARDLGVLVAEGHAADEERHAETLLHAVFVEALLDLRGEFARRLQDQGARHARAGAALLEQRQHGQCEGGGLAGARLGDAEDVAACEDVWDSLFLDGRGLRVARCGNRLEDFLAKAEFREIHVWSRLLCGIRRSWCVERRRPGRDVDRQASVHPSQGERKIEAFAAKSIRTCRRKTQKIGFWSRNA